MRTAGQTGRYDLTSGCKQDAAGRTCAAILASVGGLSRGDYRVSIKRASVSFAGAPAFYYQGRE